MANIPGLLFFVSPFPNPTTKVKLNFNRPQEAVRKNLERLYALLTARFHVSLHPKNYSTVDQMVTGTKAVAIVHNMVTEQQKDGYISRTRVGETLCQRVVRPRYEPKTGCKQLRRIP